MAAHASSLQETQIAIADSPLLNDHQTQGNRTRQCKPANGNHNVKSHGLVMLLDGFNSRFFKTVIE